MQNELIIAQNQMGYKQSMILSDVKVFGLQSAPQQVSINGQSYSNFVFDDLNMVLSIQYFYIDMTSYETITIAWS